MTNRFFSLLSEQSLLRRALECKCPACAAGALYRPGVLSFSLKEKCEVCGLDYSANDAADGPAVFLIFLLGFALVPLALILDSFFHPPLWVHAIVWLCVALFITLATLKPLKAYVLALQYRYRPGDWRR